MFSRVFSIDLRVSLRTMPMRRSGFSARVARCPSSRARACRRRPARARSARSGRRAILPTKPVEHVCQAMRRLSSNSTRCWWSSRGRRASSPCRTGRRASRGCGAALGVVHRARAVDLVMAAGIGEQGEDRFGRRGNHALDGFDVAGLGHARQRTLPGTDGGTCRADESDGREPDLLIARVADRAAAARRAARRRRPRRRRRRRRARADVDHRR